MVGIYYIRKNLRILFTISVVSLSKTFTRCSLLVQPKKTHPEITEKCSLGCKLQNQTTNKTYLDN